MLPLRYEQMGFKFSAQGSGSMLRAFIKFALPERPPARWLARLFGRYCARWCPQQMVDDAVNHFEAWPETQLSN